MRKKILSIITVLFITSLFVNITSCKMVKGNDKAIVSFIVGGPELVTESGDKRTLKVLDEVQKNDSVQTDDKSHLTVQIGSDIVLKILPNSRAKISSLLAGGEKEILLNQGTISSKISKLKKGSSYKIKTPSAVASVRGTVFCISHNPGRSVVSVGKGKVEVVRLEDNRESEKPEDTKILEKDSSAVITAAIESRPVSSLEQVKIKSISIVPLVEEIEKKSPEDLKKIEKSFSEEQKKVNRELDVGFKPMSLDQIKAKYQRIDLITLYNGKTIKGIIVSRGNVFKVITPNGTVFIPKAKIRNTSVIK